MPLRQLYPLAEAHGFEAKVDIIAVHGLNPRGRNKADHALNTWRRPAAPEGRLWLRDDLPKHIPESRIFAYEYESTVIFGKDRSTFVDKADSLLEAIRAKRKDLETRPIIFLGHSLGGLLIKQALANARFKIEYDDIRIATKGLAFFATPHNGGEKFMVNSGRIAAKIAIHLGFHKGDNILEVLNDGSLFTNTMQHHWKHQQSAYDIVSFWGTLDDIVPKESTLFGLPGSREHIVALQADHKGVCRFGDGQVDRDNFELVRSNIEDLYKKALEQSHSTPEVEKHASKDEKLCLQSLSYPEIESRYHTIESPIEDTCKWLFEDGKYRGWQEDKEAVITSNILWIQGQPGSRKSTLLKQAVVQNRKSQSHAITAAFFFNTRGSAMAKSKDGLFRSLLHQLLQQIPAFLSEFVVKYKQKKPCILQVGSGTHKS